jgi:hypothetical protein
MFSSTKMEPISRSTRELFDFILDTIPYQHDLSRFIPLLKRDATLCRVGVGKLTTPNEYGQMTRVLTRTPLAGSNTGGIRESGKLDFCAIQNINSTTYTADLGSLSFSAVSIKLMISNAAAADPLPPWRILLREAWRHKRSRPFFGRITSLCFRGLLFPRHIKSDFHG